jgi:hypothetical protein
LSASTKISVTRRATFFTVSADCLFFLQCTIRSQYVSCAATLLCKWRG